MNGKEHFLFTVMSGSIHDPAGLERPSTDRKAFIFTGATPAGIPFRR
jgi:hypothetical protein